MKLGVIPVLLAFCFRVYLTKDELQPLPFQCPSKTEWSFRAKWYCKANGGFPEENYACLYNEIKNISTETCNFKTHILEKGEQYILRHNPVGIECKDRSRYQPFRLTEFSSECAFLRSMCSEPGHVRFHEGTSVADKSCRCNFEEGYAFVSKPQKNCYCIPSREDCSCYKMNCPTDYVVTSDYHCIHKNNKSYTAGCPDMNSQQKSNSDEMKFPRPNDDHNEKVPVFQRKTLKIAGVTCLLIIVIAVILAVLIVFDKILTSKINPPFGLQISVRTSCLKLSWCKVKITGRDIYKYKILYTDNEWKNEKLKCVEGKKSFCLISNILPSKIYRFKVASCLKNSIESIPSEELEYQSGTPNPPRSLTTFLKDGNLVLKWTSPQEGLFTAETYKIFYRWNENIDGDTIVVNATKSCQIIQNICPAETYTFTIASCVKNITGSPSEKLEFHSGAPNPPRSLTTFLKDGNLVLKWTSPQEGLFTAETYKIFYSWNENIDEDHAEHMNVNATESSQIIPNICPAKTYTFTIASCLKNFVGNPSKELIFYSGVPKSPSSLQAHCIDDNIRLIWTAPEKDLFQTESYYIEVTTTMNYMKDFIVPACTLEYSIKDFILDETYRIKIYSVSGSVRSKPRQAACIASPSFYLGVMLKGKVSKNVFVDKNCQDYKTLSGYLKPLIAEVCKSLPGEQSVRDIDYSEGSFYAAFILVSKGFYDEDVLRSTFESMVKTGKFGCFSVSMDRFCFKSLDKPLPPQTVDVENIDTTVQLSWSHPPKTFFKTQKYLLQITTNKWESFKEQTIPGDKCQCTVLDVLPSTTYAFKIYTVVKYSIKSLPSNEMSTLTRGPIPPNSIEIRPIINGIMISWNKPNHPALCHIKQYHITVQEDENMYTRSTGKNETSFTMTDLKSSTTYRFQVSTISTNGLESDHSKMVEYKVKDTLQKEEEKNFQTLFQLVHGVAYNSVKKEFERGYPQLDIEKTLDEQKSYLSLSLTNEQMRILYSQSGTKIDSHQLIIDTWEIENERFKKTKVVDDILISLGKTNCVTITGMPGDGKTALMHHIALVLDKTENFNIIPCSVATDINLFYKKDQNQIFVLDDVCGKYIIDQNLVNSFIYNETVLKLILKRGNTKFISTCRKQIFQDKKFQQLQYLIGKAFDISTDYPMSVEEKTAIANEYLSPKIVEKIQGCLQSYSLFPLMCRLCHEKSPKDVLKFFDNPFDVYTEELNKLLLDDKRKSCALFLCVVFNGTISKLSLSEDRLTDCSSIAETLRSIFAKFKVDSSFLLDTLDTFLKIYFKKAGNKYLVIHDKMFDFLCSYFGEKCQTDFIQYADVKILVQHTELESLLSNKHDGDEFTVLIQKQNEDSYFLRIITEISKGNIHDVLFSEHIEKKSFRQKIITHLQKLDKSYVKKLVIVKEKTTRFQNTSIPANTPLSIASYRVYNDLVDFFLRKYIDDLKDENILAAFNIACIGGHISIVRLFLKSGIEVNKHDDKRGWTPLMHTCEKGHVDVVRLLLDHGGDVNEPNSRNVTPLMVACFNKHVDVVHVLISKAAEVNKKDDLDRTPLVIACIVGSFEIVQCLINSGADVNWNFQDNVSKDKQHFRSTMNIIFGENDENLEAKCSGWTALHIASINGNRNIAELLIKNNAQINMVNCKGFTSLMLACMNGRGEVVQLLLNSDCDINMQDSQGRSALTIACYYNKTQIVMMLISKKVQINSKDSDNKIPLHYACKNGNLSIVDILLQKKSDVNSNDNHGRSPFYEAVTSKQLGCLKSLISKGANMYKADQKRYSPLHKAAFEGFDDCVKLIMSDLRKSEKDIDILDEKGWTPLMYSCKGGRAKVVEILILHGANVDYYGKSGYTPLTVACESNHIQITSLLLTNGAKMDLEDGNGFTPLSIASVNGHSKVLEQLVSKGADVNQTNSKGWSPLRMACLRGQLNVVQLLISSGCDVDLAGNDGCTPLQIACKGGYTEIASLLIENTADINRADKEGWTPLNNASLFGHKTTIDLLIEKGAHIDQYNNSGCTPLMSACETKCVSVVEKLLLKGANPNHSSADGNTPLTRVCTNGHNDILNVLISAGANMEKTDNEGKTPLRVACDAAHLSAVEILIHNGSDVNSCDTNGMTPLNALCQGDLISIIELLINSKCNVDVPDNQGYTPLMRACACGNFTVVDLLIKAGSYIFQANHNGWTALLLAYKYNEEHIISMLKANGASIMMTSLFSACAIGDLSLTQVITEKACDFNEIRNDGLTPLMVACNNHQYSVVDFLVEKNARFNNDSKVMNLFCGEYDEEGHTVLTKACLNGHEQTVQLLIESGADPNINDQEGWSPVTRACFSGQKRVVLYLINHGVDINREDRNCRTPFLIALNQRNIEIIELLINSGLHDFNFNKIDDKGLTPLMNACKSERKLTFIKFLLSKGADVNTVGKSGFTAIQVACEAENWECLDFLLENGALFIKDCTVKKTLLDNSKVLITACKNGLKYVLNEFLSPYFDLDCIIDDEFTLLMHACSEGNDEIVNVLCNKGADVNKKNKNGLFPLMIAINNQYITTVTILIDHGAILDLLDKDEFTPLMSACQEGMIIGVKTLVSKGANRNILINQNTPLNIAFKMMRYEVVDFLLEIGVNVGSSCRSEWKYFIEQHNAEGIDLFKLCCRKGYRAMASFLISDEQIKMNIENQMYLQEACTFGHESIVSLLIEKGTWVNRQNKKGETAVLIACDNGYINILKQLIEVNVDINIADSNGYTPLHKACLKDYIDIVRLLIIKNANVNTSDKNGITPLKTVCKNGYFFIVKLLTENGVKIDKQDNKGRTALMCACKAGQYEIVTLLVQQGASINISEEDGSTALILACCDRLTKIADYLIENGADINKANHKGKSPLQCACINNSESVVKLLLSKGANIDQIDHKGRTPLMSACMAENSKIIPILIKNGANVDKINGDGYTPLRIACECMHIENVKILLNAKADVTKADRCGNSCLHAVCIVHFAQKIDVLHTIESMLPSDELSKFFSFGMEYCKFVEAFKIQFDRNIDLYNTKASAIVSLLINNCPGVNEINEQGDTALMLASRFGLPTIVDILIKHGAEINIINKNGDTSLSLACVHAHFQCISFLLNNGAKVDIVNHDGETPLTIACKGNFMSSLTSSVIISLRARSKAEFSDNRLRIIKLLLSQNADVNKPANDGWTPLMWACKWQKSDVVEFFLDNGASIHSKNNLGETALSVACMNGRLKTVEVLLERSADPNSVNSKEISPLKHACDRLRSSYSFHFETFPSLMFPKKCLLSETVSDDSIIQDVSRYDFEEIVQCLIDKGAQIDKADIDGWTPLMSACRGGLNNIAKMLIDHDADIDKAANDGQTVLMLACMSGNKNVVDLIIDKTEINGRSNKGWSALKLACKLGHTTIVNTLLKHNADVNQHDIEGWTPLMSACQNGHEEIVNLLLKYGAIANWYSNDRWHPLKLAKKGKYDRIEKILVEYGADIRDQEDEGLVD